MESATARPGAQRVGRSFEGGAKDPTGSRPGNAEPGRTPRPAARAPRESPRLGGSGSAVPGAAALRLGTPWFGIARFGTPRLSEPRSALPVRLSAAQCAWIVHMRDRIGLFLATPTRPPRPGVLSPAAHQRGHPPFARALAQGLSDRDHVTLGQAGTLARAGRRGGRRSDGSNGFTPRRPDGTAARGSTAQRLDALSGAEPVRVRSVGDTSRAARGVFRAKARVVQGTASV